VGVVDGEAGVGVGVVGDVRVGAVGAGLRDDALLEGGLRLVGAEAAAAAAPAGFAGVSAATGQIQARTAGRPRVGRDGGVGGGGAVIAGGGDEGDGGVPGGGDEVAVPRGLGGGLAAAPAHRHGDDARLPGGVIDRGEQVGVGAVVRLDEQDVGP